jgi:hypothetical protein
VASISGSYSVRAISAGCTTVASQAITVNIGNPATPSIVAQGATTVCAGTNVTINVSTPVAATTYLWSNGATGTSITVNNAGAYSVRAISFGCTSAVSQTVTITVNPIPSVPTLVASGATTFCAGGSIMLNIQNPAANTTYLWSNATTGNSINVTDAGTFSARAVSLGCTSAVSQATTVTVNTLPSATFSQAGNVLAATPVANATYQWLLNGQPIANATNISHTATVNGSYSVRITLNGCSATSNAVSVVVISVSNPISHLVKMYPNPSNGMFTIETQISAEITITDIAGKTLMIFWQEGRKVLNLSNEADGLYFVKIRTTEGTGQMKMVVQK